MFVFSLEYVSSINCFKCLILREKVIFKVDSYTVLKTIDSLFK